MENPTQFDLDRSIHRWRENLSASPAFQPEDLLELESHLRDGVASLQSKGLSTYEAFWVAQSRLGVTGVLDREYGKMNADRVWRNRALWMVIGFLVIGQLSSLGVTLARFATLGVYQLSTSVPILGPFFLVTSLGIPLGLFLGMWQLAKHGKRTFGALGNWTRKCPGAAAVSVFLLVAFTSTISICANIISAQTLPPTMYGELIRWSWPAMLLTTLGWPMVLAWLLVRARRNPAPFESVQSSDLKS